MIGEDKASPGAQAKTMQIPKRWPLVNTLNSRDGDFLKDARLVNAYAEKDPVTGEHQVEKRPGFDTEPVIAGNDSGQGIYTYPYIQTGGPSNVIGINYITLYVSGGHVFFILTDAHMVQHPAVDLGPVSYTKGTKFQFLGIPGGGSNTEVLFGGNNSTASTGLSPGAWVYKGGALFHLAAGGPENYPSNTVPGFVYLNGFCYVMDYSGAIWETSVQNEVLGAGAWSGDQITAASDNDIAVQLARQLVYVVAIKSWTTQFFYDAGNPTGSSLSPLPGAIYNFGCIDSDTFAELDGVLFWATQSKSGSYRIVMITNLNDEYISDGAVERQLALGPGSTWYSIAWQVGGKRFYLISNLTTNVTMVFDIKEKLWYLWEDFEGNYFPTIARCTAPNGDEWQQRGDTGDVFKQAPDYVFPNDSGNVVPMDIYTPNFDGGADRSKTLSQMRFKGDQVAGSKLYVRFSDDDYKTWNNPRMVDMSRKEPTLNDEGSFYRRAYHIRHYANTKQRLRSIDLQMDLGVA